MLLDPDNGQEVASATERTFHRHVKFEEVELVCDRMSPDSSFVIYQRRRDLFLNVLFQGLGCKLSEFLNCPAPLAITADRRVVILVMAENPKRWKEIELLLQEHVGSDFQVLD